MRETKFPFKRKKVENSIANKSLQDRKQWQQILMQKYSLKLKSHITDKIQFNSIQIQIQIQIGSEKSYRSNTYWLQWFTQKMLYSKKASGINWK